MNNWTKENLTMILLFILSIIIVFCFQIFLVGYDTSNLRTVKDFLVLAFAYILSVPVAFITLIALVATFRNQ